MGCTQSSQAPNVNPRDLRNQPVNKSQPYRHGSPVTMAQLARQREEFWSTRVDGSRIMWQGIRTAAEALLVDDIDLARAILEASEIITPNGTLELCYDERGHMYKIPVFCLVNPIEITGPVSSSSSTSSAAAIANSSTNNHSSYSDSRVANKKDMSYTPPPRPPGVPLNLRVRINPGDINLTLVANVSDTVLDFKRLVNEKTMTENETRTPPIPDCSETRQRVMFMGRELKNHLFLGDIKMDGSQVVQIFLRPLTTKPNN